MERLNHEIAEKILKDLIYNGQKIGISVKKTVEICEVCEGKGYKEREELTHYHNSEYSTFTDKCRECDGEGRLTVTRHKLNISHNSHKKMKVPFSKEPITKNHWETFDLFYKIEKPKK